MRALLVQFAGRDAHPAVQFIKYGLCGTLATLVDMILFYLLAWKLIPAIGPDDPAVHFLGLPVSDISVQMRAINFGIVKTLSFIFSDFVAYITNVLWVFEPGRHGKRKEVAFFYILSFISLIVSMPLGMLIILAFRLDTTYTLAVSIIVAVLINYTGRKFFIFKR